MSPPFVRLRVGLRDPSPFCTGVAHPSTAGRVVRKPRPVESHAVYAVASLGLPLIDRVEGAVACS